MRTRVAPSPAKDSYSVKETKSPREAAISSASSRILILRVAVACGLMVTAAIVGSVSYFVLSSNENQVADSRFDQIAHFVKDTLELGFLEKNDALQALAKSYAYTRSNASDWPNVVLPGFYDVAESLRGSLGFHDVTFFPLVKPEQLPSFEPFLFNYFGSEPTIASSEFLPGAPVLGDVVYAIDPNLPEIYYHDTTGETLMFESPNIILAPITQHLFSATFTAGALAFNIHSLPQIGTAIDNVINCSQRMDYASATKLCPAMSAPFALPVNSAVIDDFQSLIIQPIYLDQSSSNLVGFAAGGITWKNLLQLSFPHYINGVDCVVKHGDNVFTFTSIDGEVVFKGAGDNHESKYDSYVQTASVLRGAYMVYFYPNEEYFKSSTTDTPLVVSLCSVFLILVCSGIFLLYDLLMRRESSAKSAVLDTKRRFVRFISHEVRTPLNAVHLGLEALTAEVTHALTLLDAFLAPASPAPPPLSVIASLSGTLHSWLDLTSEMTSNSESAVDVLNDLLNYDKIEMGTLRLDFALVNIWEIVKASTAGFQSHARDKRIAMSLSDGSLLSDVEAHSSEYIVVGDSIRLAQLMRNLISNALKFTPSNGDISITVERIPGGLPGSNRVTVPPDHAELLVHPRAGSIRISVTDSGAGLSPQQLADICVEGVQFNAKELQAGGGSGLGLFISKGLAEQHGGKLTVTSEGIGKGTTFTIELPLFLAEIKLRPARKLSMEVSAPRMSAKLLKPHRISVALEPRLLILVDDAPSNRKILKRLLTAKGYVCEEAEDGQQCIDVYKQLRKAGRDIAAIVMDFEMPVMNGPTAARKLRDMGCEIPIIGVTGNVLAEDIKLYTDQGANAVLGKPLNMAKFEMLMSKYACMTPMSCQRSPRGGRCVSPGQVVADCDAQSTCDTVLVKGDSLATGGLSFCSSYADLPVQSADV